MGLTWVLSAPGGPHVGPMNLAIRVVITLSFVFSCSSPTQTKIMKSSILMSLLVLFGVESIIIEKAKEQSILDKLILKCDQGMGPSNTRSFIEHALLCEKDSKCLAIADRVNATFGYTTCYPPNDPNSDPPLAADLASAMFLRHVESPIPGTFQGVNQYKTGSLIVSCMHLIATANEHLLVFYHMQYILHFDLNRAPSNWN